MAIFGSSGGKGNAQPKGGYGASGMPSHAMRQRVEKRGKPSGSHGSYGKPSMKAPSGGYGSHGAPKNKPSPSMVTPREVGYDHVKPKICKIPSDQKTGRFNLPKGKFV